MCVIRIVVSNMEQNCRWGDLLNAFRSFGRITVTYDYHYICGRSEHIKYTVPDAARLAIQRMNLVPLFGRCLCVSIFATTHSYKR